jgi:hypothetical protein
MPYDFETADWSLIPEHCRAGLRRYIELGRSVGSFLSAVLENDLKRSCQNADDTNINHIVDYVKFLYRHAPSECWGSPDKVRTWMDKGGLYPRGSAEALAAMKREG